MAVEIPGWLTAQDASERYGIPYQSLRKLVADGVFTRGNFSGAKERPPIYLRVEELDAWKRGGVTAAKRLRDAWAAADSQNSPADPAFANELGEAGA